MIKPIKIKKNNSEKNSKPEKTADEISIFINLDDLEHAPESAPKYDCDMSPEEILASEIVFSLAGKAAESFTNAVDGLNLICDIILMSQYIAANRDLWRCESAFRPKVSVFRNRRVYRKRRLIRVSSCEVGYEAGILQKGIDSKHFTLYTICHNSNG